jgi:hypothetical protein
MMDADSMHFENCGIEFRQDNWSHNSPSRDASAYSCMQPVEVYGIFLHLESNRGRSLICHRISLERSLFEKCNFVRNWLNGPLFVMSTNTEIRDTFFIGNSASVIGKPPGKPIYVRFIDCFCDNWATLPDYVNVIGERQFGKHDTLHMGTKNQRDNCIYGRNVSINGGGHSFFAYLFVAAVIAGTVFSCGDFIGLGAKRRRVYAGAKQITEQKFDEDGSIQAAVDNTAL